MSVGTVDNNVHSEVFCTLPVDFDCVEFSKRLYEVLYTMLVFPDNCEVVYNEREADAAVQVTKKRGRVFKLVVSVAFSFLGQRGAGIIVLGTARRPEINRSGFLKPRNTGLLY
jgi:hypothetical protein